MHPHFNAENEYPLNYAVLERFQQEEDLLLLLQARNTRPNLYPIQDFNGMQLICYLANPKDYYTRRDVGQVYSLAPSSSLFCWNFEIRRFNQGGSFLSSKTSRLNCCYSWILWSLSKLQITRSWRWWIGVDPWNRAAVNLIGPRKIQIPGQQELVFNALTCALIDPASW
jgi:hypothetical protein